MIAWNGERLRVSIFGQSHGPAVGVVVEGLPAGFAVDRAALQAFLDRRAPGRGDHTSARKETDIPRFLSGLAEDTTCGAPLCVVLENGDAHSGDYDQFRDIPRPSHADYPALMKFGPAYDVRGGGQFSGRLTAPLCVAGGIALQILAQKGVRVGAHLAAVGGEMDAPFDPVNLVSADLDRVLFHPLPVLDGAAGDRMLARIRQAKEARDSLGGLVECAALGLPVGLGDALFGGLESRLSAALFAIPAVKGVEFGAGFAAAYMAGSAHNDPYILRDGQVVTRTNHAGGILGGMTTGMPVVFRAAFKPTPSIGLPQRSVRLSRMEETELVIRGRHDPCVAVRAVPAVEAAAALVLLDLMLQGEREP